jgi:hypothetical protein
MAISGERLKRMAAFLEKTDLVKALKAAVK